MNRMCKHFLSGADFSTEHYGKITFSNDLDILFCIFHLTIDCNDIVIFINSPHLADELICLLTAETFLIQGNLNTVIVASTVLPFAPAAIYRNDEVTTSAALSPYDVYYYNESARTVWIYNKRAAGRVTAVSPSASAPTSVTVAGVTYTIASPSVAYQLSSLSGGGVGQVVTLLLGMNNVAAGIITGEEADEVFYGVVQSASRNLIDEDNSADVLPAPSWRRTALRCSRLSRSCVPTAPPAPSM